jgi:hypothetical protein
MPPPTAAFGIRIQLPVASSKRSTVPFAICIPGAQLQCDSMTTMPACG